MVKSNKKPRPQAPPRPHGPPPNRSEVTDAAKTLGKATATLGKAATRTTWELGTKHKWAPALAGGYYLGATANNRAERAQNRHPYQGYYG